MLSFPRSSVLKFYNDNPLWREKGQRLGQVFHEYFHLHKITNTEDKFVCDNLYNARSSDACKIIIKHTDWSQ